MSLADAAVRLCLKPVFCSVAPQHPVYAGIGSRETPIAVLGVLEALATVLARAGFVLRSGAALGADAAFEAGADRAGGVKEIYLPWKGFNGNQSERFIVPNEAFALAEEFHPLGRKLRSSALPLKVRPGYVSATNFVLKRSSLISTCREKTLCHWPTS